MYIMRVSRLIKYSIVQGTLSNFKLSTAFALLLILVSNPQTIHAADDVQTLLFRSINERLSYMESVALYKAENELAVEDIGREKEVIENAKLNAAREGLDPESVESFFIAQISVAKVIQYRHQAQWLLSPPEQEAVNLEIDIRPRLNDLGTDITILLGILIEQEGKISAEARNLFYQTIEQTFVTEEEKDLLFNGLLQVSTQQ